MSTDSNGVSTREHLEAVLQRVESTVKDQLSDVKATYVPRSEYHAQVTSIYRELDRVDRDNERRVGELRDDINAVREDVVNENRKNLAIIGIVISVIEFAIRNLT